MANGGFGFLRAAKARQAEDAIARAESLLAVLHLETVDLRGPDALLLGAKKAYAAQDYARATDAAHVAEKIAVRIEDDFRGYEKALAALTERIDEARRLGLTTDAMEDALRRAEERVASGVWHDPLQIPDYVTSCSILNEAEADGKGLVEKAAAASNAVFMAELAIEGLASVPGPKDRDTFETGAASALESALEGATRRLAMRKYDDAARVAKDIEARATRLRGEFGEATDILAATSAVLADLRTKGVDTGRLTSQLALSRDALHRGVIEPAAGMARRLADDTRKLAGAYQRAASWIANATNRYSALVREGHLSVAADRSILDARRAMRDGDYLGAVARLEEAEAAILRAEAERGVLARSLQERRQSFTVPATTPLREEAQEILGRAEAAFRSGDYSSANEDLVLATLLLGTATPRAGDSKG